MNGNLEVVTVHTASNGDAGIGGNVLPAALAIDAIVAHALAAQSPPIPRENLLRLHCINSLLLPPLGARHPMDFTPSFSVALRQRLPEILAIANVGNPSTSALLVDGVAALLSLSSESIPSILRSLEELVSVCGELTSGWSILRFACIIFVDNPLLHPPSQYSAFAFADVLDTLAVRVYSVVSPKTPVEKQLVESERWTFADMHFARYAAGNGVFGRVRKGSVKQRIAVRLSQTTMDEDNPTDSGAGHNEMFLETSDAQALVDGVHTCADPSLSLHVGVAVDSSIGPVQPTPSTVTAPTVAAVSKRVDPTSNLTFNLNLTDEQRKMRDAAELPYVHRGNKDGSFAEVGADKGGGGGFIHYAADAGDDDEDLDDDLAL
ncbi:hypothetical protein HDU82_004572 [Entophlyctis luteolus]|nr:hypothetical protein HDU82_004565 [Entophlyctis luteolus]KAJ3206338.1 hypothetical protein HDU82_004572 [Entophlyctis luteolus]